MLVREGNGACCASARATIRTSAHRWEKAVKTKALARREAYPPVKSLVPQMKTAARLQAAGANWDAAGMSVEGSTGRGKDQWPGVSGWWLVIRHHGPVSSKTFVGPGTA